MQKKWGRPKGKGKPLSTETKKRISAGVKAAYQRMKQTDGGDMDGLEQLFDRNNQ